MSSYISLAFFFQVGCDSSPLPLLHSEQQDKEAEGRQVVPRVRGHVRPLRAHGAVSATLTGLEGHPSSKLLQPRR